MSDFEYPATRRISYGNSYDGGGMQFVPVCPHCGRYVKADATLDYRYNECNGITTFPNGNATCKKCGRVEMPFEGYL